MLLQPITLGPLTAKNRLMMTTHNPKLTDPRYLGYLEERVAGGVAMVGIPVLHECISSIFFTTSGRIDPSYSADLDATPDGTTEEGAAFYDAQIIPRLEARAKIAHRHGALIFGQLAERGAGRIQDTFQPRVAPSVRPDDFVRAIPHGLTIPEIKLLVTQFGRSAARIRRAGLDGVEIHATHGYLVEQFLSPLTNTRDDEYGGSFDNRLRFLDEIIAEVRRVCGAEFPIGMRLSARQVAPGGLSTEDAAAIAGRVGSHLAYLNITAGTISALQNGAGLPYVAPSYLPPGFNVEAAAKIRAASPVPTGVSGRINSPELMQSILESGAADFIGVARTLLADPDFVTKLAAGQKHRIRRCIGANECHYPDRPSACAVNAAAGREKELSYDKAARSKKVVIAGGGPAGLEAARVAALRGHRVVLFEKSDRLGGQMNLWARDPARKEMADYIRYLEGELALHKVEVRLGTAATPELLGGLAADAIILATGSKPWIPAVSGLDRARAFSAAQVFANPALAEGRVLVVGGLDDHFGPPGTAEWLADHGASVTLMTECLAVGLGLEPAMLHMSNKRLLDRGIRILTLSELTQADPVTVRNVYTGKSERLADIDTIVFAAGSRAENELAGQVRTLAQEIYEIGDCLAPRRIVHATLDGARIGLRL